MIVADILLDALFAAVAAIGFGAISDPPMRAFPRIAALAAVGCFTDFRRRNLPDAARDGASGILNGCIFRISI